MRRHTGYRVPLRSIDVLTFRLAKVGRYPDRPGEMAGLYGLRSPELPPHHPQKAYMHTRVFFHGGTDLAVIHEGDRMEESSKIKALRSWIPTRKPIAPPTQPPSPPPAKGPPPAEDHVATEIWNFTQTLAAMSKRVDGIDEKILAMEKRLDAIDEQLEAMDKYFNKRLDGIDDQLEDLRGQIHDQTRHC